MSSAPHEGLDNRPEFGPDFRADLHDLLTWRRDVRQFQSKPLPPDSLERLLGLACLAPSVGLSEPWRFVLVDDAGRRGAIRACFEDSNREALRAQSTDRVGLYARLKLAGLDEAPCQIAVFADISTDQGHGLGRLTMPEMIEYSVVIAVHTLWLAARAEGIGMGWISILDPKRVATILNVPPAWKLIAYLCLGYPKEDHEIPVLQREGWEHRRPLASTISRR